MTYADAQARIIADAPWGFWPQTETAGSATLADASGAGRHMTITGAPVLGTVGPHGAPATSWTGPDYARTATGFVSSPFTIACWVYLTPAFVAGLSTLNYGGAPVVCHEDLAGSRSHDKNLTVIRRLGDKAAFAWYVNNGSTQRVHAEISVPAPMWVHVVASVGPAGAKLRVNKLPGEINAAVVSSYTGRTLRTEINKVDPAQGAESAALPGIALPAVWTRQLTDAETDAQYDALLLPPPPTPVLLPAAPGIASQMVLSQVGLNPNPDGPDAPAQQWWDADASDAFTYNPARSEGLAAYTISYAARTPLDKPQPLAVSASVLVPVGESIAIGDRFRLRLSPTLAAVLELTDADAIRATCIVTDVESDPSRVWTLPGHGPATLYTVTATGWRVRYGAASIDGTGWPTEPPAARLARILDPLGLTGDLDAGGPNLIPPQAPGTANAALGAVADSVRGRLIEQRTGSTDYDDPESRRGTLPALSLDAAEILGDAFTWRQSVGDVVNEATVTYGTGSDSTTIHDPASADPRSGVGPYPAQLSTVLGSHADAVDLANDVVGRRAWPYYQLPAVVVDLARSGLDLARLTTMFRVVSGHRVALTDMPAGSPWDTLPRGCFIEGYVETATPYAWRVSLVVSDPALSGVSLRYIDVPDDPAYTYAAVLPDLSYLDVSRIEDPADLT